MTEKQIKKYEELAELKEQYEKFIEKDGDIGIAQYSRLYNDDLYYKIHDEEFKTLVKNLAKERLKVINQKIKEI